jgi:hypothetical protein
MAYKPVGGTRAFTLQDVISLLSAESEPFVDTGEVELLNQFVSAQETPRTGELATVTTAASAAAKWGGKPILQELFNNSPANDWDGASTINATLARGFQSFGTDSSGTLSAWQTLVGSASISSNQVTVTAGTTLAGGHTDWGLMLANVRARFQFSTNSQPCIYMGLRDTQNWYRLRFDGTNMFCERSIAGSITTLQTVSQALSNATWYWVDGLLPLRWTLANDQLLALSQLNIQGTLYADSAGARGAAINTSLAANIASSDLVTSGRIGIGNPGTASCLFGGAFATVFTVGPANPFTSDSSQSLPRYWLPVVPTDDTSFAWSAAQAAFGRSSLSISNPGAILDGRINEWYELDGVTNHYPVSSSKQYQVSCRIRTTGVQSRSSTSGAFLHIIEYNAGGTVTKDWAAPAGFPYLIGTQNWTNVSFIFTTQATTTQIDVRPALNTKGTAWYDVLTLALDDSTQTRYGYGTWS